uniref:Tc1-like transposase DDE domain-containing protein n=1 Tax=Cyprinus carpio carpio TaxID=630221 RepID=A0A9J7XDY9_CYPCA
SGSSGQPLWQAQVLETLSELRVAWIPPSISRFLRTFNVQESVKRLKLRWGWLFQQDNDLKHCSKSTKEFMHRTRYNVLEWPSQSPDLNIIKHLWIDLKQVVHTRQPSNRQRFYKEE